MRRWAFFFLILALIAGVFGFTDITGTAVRIGQVLFILFLVMFMVLFLVGRRPPF